MLTNKELELSLNVKVVYNAKKSLRDHFANEDNLSRYGKNVLLLAALKNMSLESVGLTAGYNKFFVLRLIRMEKGCRNPNAKSIMAIAKVLGVNPSFLINGNVQQIFCDAVEKAQEGFE